MNKIIVWQIIITIILPIMVWYFKVKIPAKIKYDYDFKLSELESKLKLEEKVMEDLRRNAIVGAEKRQGILYTRKLEACDELWEEVQKLTSLKALSTYLMGIKEDEFLKSDYKNSNNSLLIESFGKITGFESQKKQTTKNKLSLQRPYLSERLWALYLAHSSVSIIIINKYESLKNGIDIRNLIDYNGILNLIKKVEPLKFSAYTEISSVNAFIILEVLENNVLNEIKKIHSGIEEDKKNIETNREIIKYAEELRIKEKLKDK
ncbi:MULTISPECIES: hypothetical protein [Psychrilyobacter]|uniref:Uncharacterized protein n=1 Tax=Psychrilyobacter piezotolerans TaxID=2293438 RepID=A0ABX9KKF9_9FUSO|nr:MULTISPECIES: hypothetical protein [Psychrilyobacter]MCS5421874.1 hypothetical protein [Psychrilyobacter sp. S5]NDI76971.1 hypothetical protein [Psychrilyobacter piezotolerans]RDE64588.1 hypothetical protein DV867_03345 [Psychrilyobacter sp. S5]REI42400.1 hypothetical protein DYH56_03345 [Psychrilyobacter piezotolerans]